jgi:hypothetical protein
MSLSSKIVFDEWPSALRALFDGSLRGAPDGFTASLAAVDHAGRVRTALLSAGELYVPDAQNAQSARTLCFALWPASRAAQAIIANGRATLTFVADDAFYQIQLDAHRVALEGAPLACFVATIESGEAQRVGYARLTSGIAFELSDAGEVHARWREQMEWLKRAAIAAR